MPPRTEQESAQEALHKPNGQRETLSFQNPSRQAPSKSLTQGTHAVRRDWGQNGAPLANRAAQQQAQASTYGSTNPSPMTQRWQAEINREQPYNNVGAYMTKNENDGATEVARGKQYGSRSSLSGQKGSAASNC